METLFFIIFLLPIAVLVWIICVSITILLIGDTYRWWKERKDVDSYTVRWR